MQLDDRADEDTSDFDRPVNRPRGSRPIQIVATPGAGNGAAAAMAARLREALHARGHESGWTSSPSQGAARWAATGPSRISDLISVGGDGTQIAVATAAVSMLRAVPAGGLRLRVISSRACSGWQPASST